MKHTFRTELFPLPIQRKLVMPVDIMSSNKNSRNLGSAPVKYTEKPHRPPNDISDHCERFRLFFLDKR
jgi:hypothetical protein